MAFGKTRDAGSSDKDSKARTFETSNAPLSCRRSFVVPAFQEYLFIPTRDERHSAFDLPA